MKTGSSTCLFFYIAQIHIWLKQSDICTYIKNYISFGYNQHVKQKLYITDFTSHNVINVTSCDYS